VGLIATDVASSVVLLCVCIGHMGELCKNGWTDRDAVWSADSCALNEPVLDGVKIGLA